MKIYRNHLLAGSGAILLAVSTLLGAPRPTGGPAARPFGTVSPAAAAKPPAEFSDRADDLSVEVSFGDQQITLERKRRRSPRCCLVVIAIIGVLVGKPGAGGGPPVVDLRAEVAGPDAGRGSLPFAIAWIAGNPDPAGAVRALGYDIEVIEEQGHPCADGPQGQTCLDLARRLATLVDAALGLGDAEERTRFRADAARLGVTPDCVVGTTQSAASLLSAASPDRSVNLSMDVSFGDRQIVLERRRGDREGKYMEFKLKEVIISRAAPSDDEAPQEIELRARITGADMVPGSFPYALAWLAGDPDPLSAVRALGYDLEARTLYERPCAGQVPDQTCLDVARKLATLIDATLAFGAPEERARFRRDASAIGAAIECSPQQP